MQGERLKFLLNMQIIVDEFEESFSEISFYKGNDRGILEGVRFYYGQDRLESAFVYIARGCDLPEYYSGNNHCSLIVLGNVPEGWIEQKHSMIQMSDALPVFEVADVCQNVFQKNQSWSDHLREIMIKEGSIDDLCKISYHYFQNPLFVHDAQLYIISCPVWRKGMIEWAQDELTGLVITPLDTINEFKTDKEYMHTLKTNGAQLFSASLRGYRDIYVNIRDEHGRYIGRLCICELENALKPGQHLAAEYLAELIRILLTRRRLQSNTYHQAMELMLKGMIDGKEYPEEEVSKRIQQYNWKRNDNYICIRIDLEERDRNLMSAVSLCSHIEAKIEGSKVLCSDKHICVIINLSQNKEYPSDIACILRDGLFKAGISNVFSDFMQLGDYYHQAVIALRYCRKKADMRWSLSFNEIVLDYMIDTLCTDLKLDYICASELVRLREFDENNMTELYKTLKMYIQNERNTVKTSKELYISRSTLFYRLRKIKEIIGLDPDSISDPRLNLYLRLSIYMLEREKEA